MNRHALIYLFSFLLLTAGGCAEDLPPSRPEAVLEGWIDSDGFPVVLFTSSVAPSSDGGTLADVMIRWGKVTISDGENTVIMTGGPSDRYMPPFRYYTFDMRGIPGHTYTITAEYNDLHATATCTMPSPTPIDRLEIKPVEGSDSLRAATIHFTAPEDCPAYYCVRVRDLSKPSRPMPAMMGIAKAAEPGAMMQLPVFHSKTHLSDDPFVPQLKQGERLRVELCRITKDVYEFWRIYDDAVMFGGSQFVGGHESLPSNVEGGLGVWSAQGTSSVDIEVE